MPEYDKQQKWEWNFSFNKKYNSHNRKQQQQQQQQQQPVIHQNCICGRQGPARKTLYGKSFVGED